MPAGCDPVGELEIAERLGVKPGTVRQWKWRGHLPDPRWTVSGRDAWHWPDVKAHLDALGLPRSHQY